MTLQCYLVEEKRATENDITFVFGTVQHGTIKVFVDGHAKSQRIIRGMQLRCPEKIEIPLKIVGNDKKKPANGNNSNNKPDKSKDTFSSYFQTFNNRLFINTNRVITLVAKSIPDNHSYAPILAPDVFRLKNVEHKMSCGGEGRLWYNCLRHNLSRRRYVKGSYHNNMFNHKYSDIIDWRESGDMDILVILPDKTLSKISIRRAPEQLSRKILLMNEALKSKRCNCRGLRFGDEGKMYSMGKRSETQEYVVSEKDSNIRSLMTSIGIERRSWFQNEFPKEFEEHFSTENNLDYMKPCLSDFMVHSINLRNASHYDVSDVTITTTTWVEDQIGNTDNWYFLFPNVTRDMETAIVIKLFHGCTINWDGAKLRHCSSLTRLRGGNGTSAGNCELRRRRRRGPRNTTEGITQQIT